MEIKWVCEKCGKSATIVYDARAWMEEVINFITRNHDLISPECKLANYQTCVHLKEAEEP